MNVVKNFFSIMVLIFLLVSCGGGGGKKNSSSAAAATSNSPASSVPSQTQTQFGIGGTSPLFNSPGNINAVISLLKQKSLSRDPSQLPANSIELQQLDYIDAIRTNSLYSSENYHLQIIRTLNQKANIADSVKGFVEVDMKNNTNLWMISGGHTGHNYVAMDGKFIDILFEMANYIALTRSGRVYDSIYFAADNIVAYHLSSNRTLPSGGYIYDLLTPQERVDANALFLSLVGAIYYHEYGHYMLLHMLDISRANYDATGLVQYSSANEDDADFIAGALSAKAGLDVQAGQLMFDLMAFYSAYKGGYVFNFANITNNYVIQFQQNTVTYSSLAVRKTNFINGFNNY